MRACQQPVPQADGARWFAKLLIGLCQVGPNPGLWATAGLDRSRLGHRSVGGSLGSHPMAGDPGHRLSSLESRAHSMEKVNTGVSFLVQGDLGDPGVPLHHSQVRVEDGGMVGASVGVGIRARFQYCSKCHHSSVLGKAVKLFVAQFSYLKKNTNNSYLSGSL